MELSNGHGGYAGRTLQVVIQESLDKGLLDFDDATGVESLKLQGYVAGIAKALGILRGSSVATEVENARQRLRESKKSTMEIIEDSTSIGVDR